MASRQPRRKQVCVTMTEKDYNRLYFLSKESCRTLPGYIRWIIQQHFETLDQQPPDDRPSP